MTWFKVDDGFYDHPKSARISLAATGLWVRAGSWCGKQEHDGIIPSYMLPMLANGASTRTTNRLVAELVEAGLWEEVQGIGWLVHDWHLYQPSRAERDAEREATRRRQAEWRRRKREGGSSDAA